MLILVSDTSAQMFAFRCANIGAQRYDMIYKIYDIIMIIGAPTVAPLPNGGLQKPHAFLL